MKERPFSILIDESADITVTQKLAIVVLFFDEQVESLATQLYKIVDLAKADL